MDSKLNTELAARHESEAGEGERFRFGENWRRFLGALDEGRVASATQSLAGVLGRSDLVGMSFLDVGSGSGLSSLAAHRLGADVLSFDYDPESVSCTEYVRDKYRRDQRKWTVVHGSVLDDGFMSSLGTFDIVYSWGVLHHTGHMWAAIENVLPRVTQGGTLFIAIYNDQGAWSQRWRAVKRIYCSGVPGRMAMSAIIIPYWIVRLALSDLVRGRAPWHTMARYRERRGMSIWHDWHDWLGGFPFEFAKPEEIILPLQGRGFVLTNLVTQYGTEGCVEYVFRKE